MNPEKRRLVQVAECMQCDGNRAVPLCGHGDDAFGRHDLTQFGGKAAPLCQAHCNDRHSNLGGWAARRWRHEMDVEERMRELEFGDD